jgi:streptogramin lyase
VDAAENVYFSEFDASRVRRLDARTRRITTVAR